jgi:zinc and cadmium transporter
MLGVGVFHLVPHATVQVESVDDVALWTMVGILSMFFLMRLFHFHVHEATVHGSVQADVKTGCELAHEQGPEVPGTSAGHRECGHVHELGWLGVALGLTLHSLVDGMALAASVFAEAQAGERGGLLLGAGTFLAILLHKPLDAIPITTLMAASGWTRSWQKTVNVAFATVCPLGALAFLMGAQQFEDYRPRILGCALAFSAGVFVCIALSDLLPEIEFHAHDRVKLSACLLVGVLAAYAIRYLEPEHVHGASHIHGEDSDSHHEDKTDEPR